MRRSSICAIYCRGGSAIAGLAIRARSGPLNSVAPLGKDCGHLLQKNPQLKAIAGELGITGKGDGFIKCGGDKVTWCFGHMLEQADPDEYTPDAVHSRGRHQATRQGQ